MRGCVPNTDVYNTIQLIIAKVILTRGMYRDVV